MTETAAPQPLVRLHDVSVRLTGQEILQHIDLQVESGRILTLIGPNGAGKTTLVRIVLGLLRPDSGSVWSAPNLRIGYMPQKLQIHPTLPLTVTRFLQLLPDIDVAQIRNALAEVGAQHTLKRPMQGLSGGELQRVLLARALLRKPKILVLDEPVQGVDINGQAELYRLIGELRQRRGCGVLMVSHDLNLVMANTDEVVCLNHHICCSGNPDAISSDPAFIALFGDAARSLALYHHHHDHRHSLQGDVIQPQTTNPHHKHLHNGPCNHA